MTHDGHKESHDKHEGHGVAMFRDRFWVSFALTLPVVFLGETVQGWLGYTAPTFPGSGWVSPMLGTVIFIYGGHRS
jgi:Cu2+-exporting ATPase